MRQRASLCTEVIHAILGQLSSQDFNGSIGIQMDMFAQVNIGEASLAEQANQPIIAE